MTVNLKLNIITASVCVLLFYTTLIAAGSICPTHQYNREECRRIRFIPCETSASCKSGKICCYNGCGYSCRVPQKPGMCPAPKGAGICAFMCKYDQQCDGNLKCCRTACGGTTCKKPIFPPSKPGFCPKDNIVCIRNVCNHDSECPGRKKCCSNGCRCANPRSNDEAFLDELLEDMMSMT